jgi:hypothetical protein
MDFSEAIKVLFLRLFETRLPYLVHGLSQEGAPV